MQRIGPKAQAGRVSVPREAEWAGPLDGGGVGLDSLNSNHTNNNNTHNTTNKNTNITTNTTNTNDHDNGPWRRARRRTSFRPSSRGVAATKPAPPETLAGLATIDCKQ